MTGSTGQVPFKKIFLIVIPAVFIVIGFYIFWFFKSGLSNDPSQWGQFGDYIGGLLNPFFSLLAFVALLYTIRLQIDQIKQTEKQLKQTEEDLELTRKELELSRNELAKSAQAQSAQVENFIIKKQLDEITYVIKILMERLDILFESKIETGKNSEDSIKSYVNKYQPYSNQLQSMDNLLMRLKNNLLDSSHRLNKTFMLIDDVFKLIIDFLQKYQQISKDLNGKDVPIVIFVKYTYEMHLKYLAFVEQKINIKLLDQSIYNYFGQMGNDDH